MDKERLEKTIIEAMKLIVLAYKAYYPEADYLSLCFIEDENGTYIHADNAANKDKPVELVWRGKGEEVVK